jgi:hypothetical protein
MPELTDDERAHLRSLEESLWRVDTRFDRAHVDGLLAEDFVEFGRSGRIHARDAILASSPGRFEAVLPLPSFTARLLAPDAALLTYDSIVTYDEGVLRARRSSIWTRTPTGWRLRFHQGTPFEA